MKQHVTIASATFHTLLTSLIVGEEYSIKIYKFTNCSDTLYTHFPAGFSCSTLEVRVSIYSLPIPLPTCSILDVKFPLFQIHRYQVFMLECQGFREFCWRKYSLFRATFSILLLELQDLTDIIYMHRQFGTDRNGTISKLALICVQKRLHAFQKFVTFNLIMVHQARRTSVQSLELQYVWTSTSTVVHNSYWSIEV